VIRALICDLDNTLFPARSVPRTTLQPALDAVRAINRAASLVPAARLEEAFEACWELSFDQVAVRYALPDALCRAWAAAAEQLEITERLQPYPDVAVLWTLPLRLFLVTTGYRRFQESKIAGLALNRRFEAIYLDALDEPGRAGKEVLFRRVLAERQLAAREVAVLGDSAHSEIAAGSRLGLWTIQILREKVVPDSSAHWRIRSLGELPPVLAQISREGGTQHAG
jgi:FMN phosphatase YigB (HAD superfamily)